jgi:hypothetical protein
MTLSSFDRRMMEEGLDWFSRPRLASLLEMLGADDRERMDSLMTMLRHAPEIEFEDAVDLFERATARATRQRACDEDSGRAEESRRRRYSAAAERREQRRRGERLEG